MSDFFKVDPIIFRKSPKPKESSKKSKESRVWPLGGAPKDMGSLDYTKDKEAAETAALSPQAVYLPDPKVYNKPPFFVLSVGHS